MRKKLLSALPVKERTTPRNEYKWTLEAEITDITKERILVINAYYKDNTNPNYRSFITDKEYATQDFQCEGTWRNGKLNHYVSWEYWKRDIKGVFVEEKYKDVIASYTGVHDNNVMEIIRKHQDKISAAIILAKEKKITDPIDKKMEEIKELPSDWNEWLKNEVFINSRYIYYQYNKKVNMEGYCTHCNSDVIVYKPTLNQTGICPNCKSNIIYKSIGKSTQVYDKRSVAVFQKTNEGFVIRYFNLTKAYGRDYIHSKIWSDERYRVFYDKKFNTESYEYSLFKNKYTRWNVGGSYYKNEKYNIYPYNMDMLKDTILKYSAIEKLASNRKDFAFNVSGFIKEYKEGNVLIEHLIKVGLYNLARDLICVRRGIKLDENTLNKKLGLENDDIKIIIEADASFEMLNLFKRLRELGKRLTVAQLKECAEYRSDKLEVILRHAPISKALRYLREIKLKEKETYYADYLNTCENLFQDMKNTFVLFPKNLKKAHDVNVELLNAIKNEKKYREHNSKYAAIKKMNKELNLLYGFEDKKFLIRAPLDAAEIVKEGQTLHHCVGVGHYSEDMAKKKIAILFLREKQNPDVSYYTLEINRATNEIRQCHGYKNKDTDKAKIDKFINKFKKAKLNSKDIAV